MNKRLWILVTAVVLLGTVGVVGKKQGWWGSTGDQLEVETVKLQVQTIVETVNAAGKIQPAVEVKISPEVSGEIIALPVVEGQAVKRGQLLAKINPDIYQSMLGRAEAALNMARSGKAQAQAQFLEATQSYKRSQTLKLQNVISQAEWDAAERMYAVAELAVESAEFQLQSAFNSVKEAKDNLKRTVITAPMDGIVTGLNVEVGERVVGTAQMAGTEMMRVSQLETMEVLVDVNENDIVRVHMGDTAIVRVDAFLGHEFKAVVTEISNAAKGQQLSVNQVTNFEVELRILAESYEDLVETQGVQPLRSGMTATVDIRTQKSPNALCVPVEAVTTRMDSVSGKMQEVLFVYQEGMAVQYRAVTGIQDEQYIVLKNFDSFESAEIIRGPFDAVSRKLEDGDQVTIKEPVKK
ncbi:MAG TPA: efflux RND transporter periplasmic adaptor subunit [Cryomorphaceae bacterium]|jgi:HlyD family secretion protein|nr:efflux RND transporter periplasmic adaptor subunit [Cryomorphaceae bacterium]HBJ71791.1 efflux RND transporter periplasmic adaptor subunit [Cryomorphaceae bacterium]